MQGRDQSKVLHEVESRNARAEHRAQAVHRIEARGAAARFEGTFLQPRREQWQGAAHEQGGKNEQAHAERGLEREEQGGSIQQTGANTDEQPVRQRVKHREEKSVETDGYLDEAVGAQRTGKGVGASGEYSIAEREPPHEDSEHDSLRLNGAAEHLRKILRPDHFVNEGRGSRAEEQAEDQPSVTAILVHRRVGLSTNGAAVDVSVVSLLTNQDSRLFPRIAALGLNPLRSES